VVRDTCQSRACEDGSKAGLLNEAATNRLQHSYWY